MSHLNDLQAEFGDRGLTIIGVTDESKSQTEPWIEKHGAKYPYAYYSGSDLKSFAKVAGIPAAMLVNPEGRVVWRGHPGNLTGSIIEEHLRGALPTPLFKFPKGASKVKKAIKAGKLAEAQEMASAYVADGGVMSAEILEAVRGMVSARVDGLKSAHEAGDYLTLVSGGPVAIKALKGLPEAAEIQALLDAIEGDDQADRVIKAQREIAKMKSDVEKLKKRKAADKLIAKLSKLADEFGDGFVSGQATEFIEELKKLRPKLK